MDKERKILDKLNIDAMFLTDYFNKRYFTGFTGTTGQAIVFKDKKNFYSDFRYVEQATLQTKPNNYDFYQIGKDGQEIFYKHLVENKVKRLGYDDMSMTVAEFEMYKKLFVGIEFVPAGKEMLEARKIKDEKEIEKLRMAAKISDIAFRETIKIIKEGMTEKEIAAHLEYVQRLNGADDKSFETIVASGHRSSMPHGVASDKKIKKNEFIVMDFGCLYQGYASDITRTVFFGDNISEDEKNLYDMVYNAQSLGFSMVKEGVVGKDVDQAVRDYFDENGNMSKYFGHSLGHSFGLEVHEMPYCSKLGNEKLVANELMTIEPGLYIEGKYGVRIEDDLLITKDGYELLTQSKRELIMIKPN
ncbi:M24 family metallopeptidase [Oceanivirga miroungae]|uniref:Peptidase M24 n=1 Tax=Oceanivirga miroungae TaxID=1130046 RepID=A0A6I8M8I0_9FUSO|nr:Xaa-Pro peptidase family protein [Oceanivirga miroungae]VWL85781.1 peptidase M24 [Oceanivirga miroungae]